MRTLISAVLILVGQAILADEIPKTCIVTTHSKDQKTAFRFEVADGHIARLPDWNPAMAVIPLQPHDAARLALVRYKELYPTASSATITGLTLVRIKKTNGTKWAYWIDLSVDQDKKDTLPGEAVSVLVVLFDGTVVDPIVDPHPSVFPLR